MIKKLIVLLALALPLWALAGCGSGTSPRSAATSIAPTTASSPTGAGDTATTGTGGTGAGGTGAGGVGTGGAGTTAPTRTATTTKSVNPVNAVQLTDKDNGTTIVVPKGSTVMVVLTSTYWSIGPVSNAAVLREVGPVATVPSPIGSCVPGGGCGTVTVTYTAAGSGRAQINASRTTCGEARTCGGPGAAGSYTVEVNVSG